MTQEGVTSLRQRKRDLKDQLQLREGWGEVSAEQQKYKNRFKVNTKPRRLNTFKVEVAIEVGV